MTGYFKKFNKNLTLSFRVTDKQLLKNNNRVWEKIEKLMKIDGLPFGIFFNFCFFSSNILRYLFFPYSIFLFLSSSDRFLYVSLACSFSLFYYFYNNLLLYLIIFLCFLDNKLHMYFQGIRPFYIIKKNYNTPFLSIKLEFFIRIFALRLLIYGK